MQRLEAYARAAAENAEADATGALVYSDDPAVAGMIATSVEFTRLFIGPPRPAADLWETVNDPYNDKKVGYGRATVAMQQLLAAEGLELGGENNQFGDHMGIELLYLSALCGKTAAGFAEGDEAVRPVANKAAWFIKAHPLFWMQRFRANVDAERPEGYYSALLEYVDGVAGRPLRHAGVAPSPRPPCAGCVAVPQLSRNGRGMRGSATLFARGGGTLQNVQRQLHGVQRFARLQRSIVNALEEVSFRHQPKRTQVFGGHSPLSAIGSTPKKTLALSLLV